MHAKMTRDRKKCFIASLKRVICKLEDENQQLRQTLESSRVDEKPPANNERRKTGEFLFTSYPSGTEANQGSAPSTMFNSNIYTVG